jgi:hypothetical protein
VSPVRYELGCYIPEDGILISIYLALSATIGFGIYSACNTNDRQKERIKRYLGSREQPVRKADNLTAICEPTV